MRTIILSLLTLVALTGAQTNGGSGSALPGTCITNSTFVLSGVPYTCTATNTWTPMPSGVIGRATAVSLNSVADTAITVPYAKYIVRRFTVTNCSTTPTLAQLALFTGAAASGTTVVAAALLTALDATTKMLDMTLALTTSTLTSATLYARNTVVNGSALTCDAYVFGDVLP